MIGRNIAITLTGFIVLVNLQSSVGVLHEKCLLSVAEGNCSETIQRWYYNNKTGLCQAFVYRGCNGNANNFNSTEYCYHACNASAADERHSYSIAGTLSKNKGNLERSSSAAGAADSGRESEQSSSTDAVTPPTSFENAGPNRPASANNGNPVAPTREPTLIQNTDDSDMYAENFGASGSTETRGPPGSQPKKPRQAVGGATPGAAAAGSSSDSAAAQTRTKRETSNKSRKGHRQSSSEQSENESEKPAETSGHSESSPRRKKNKPVRESAREYDEDSVVGKKTSMKNTKNSGEDHHDAVENLVSHIESTADKLQQIASIAKSGKKKTAKMSVENDEEEHVEDEKKTVKKTADDHEKDEKVEEEADEHQEQEKKENPAKRTASSRRRHHSRKRTHAKKTSAAVTASSKRSGRKGADETAPSKSGRTLIDVSVISGDAIVERRTGSRLAEMLRMGLDEGRQAILDNEANKNGKEAAVNNDNDDDDDDEIEIIGERIKTIIYDPSYVFSYTNITGDDMVSLQEIVSQSDVGTLQLIEKGEAKRRKLEMAEADSEKPVGNEAEVTGNAGEKTSETMSAHSSIEAAGSEKTVEGTEKKDDGKDKKDTDTAVTEKKTNEHQS